MGKFVIEGGKRISGKIKAERAKNAVLPILAACILTDDEVKIKDCPDIADVKNMLKILGALGAKYRFDGNDLVLRCDGINDYEVPESLSKELRSSIFVSGALCARLRRAELSMPGGCNIGKRPIDLHIAALKALGVTTRESENGVSFKCEKLTGGKITLKIPSVGATENAMIAAATAEGETLILNAAREPEVKDLADFLCALGGKVYGAGTKTVRVEGVKKLHAAEYTPVSDRIEAGTYLVAAAITGGEIEISGVSGENISALIGKLCDNSCKLLIKNDIIYLRGARRRKPFYLRTGFYPLFPTDMQAQFTALAAASGGVSVIEESVFENRFAYAAELNKMGADVSVRGETAIVRGVKGFHGAAVKAADLRGGAALVLAALNAEGFSVVDGVSHIERGYVRMEEKLKSLGAQIVKIN